MEQSVTECGEWSASLQITLSDLERSFQFHDKYIEQYMHIINKTNYNNKSHA